jgi:hypothetical protein
VVVAGVVLLAVLAAGAAVVGGASGAAGVLAGGALAIGSFRWLTSSALAASPGAGRAAVRWLPGAALRLSAIAVAAAVVLAGDWAHPVGLVAGLTVVPCAVIGAGLRGARPEARS